VVAPFPGRPPDRTFLRDVLGLEWVDAGHGWLIFTLPPAEVAVHPTDGAPAAELYLMCDELPGGGTVGLHAPRHPSPVRRG
jgi:hypothetical protein